MTPMGKTGPKAIPAIDEIPQIPTDGNAEIVFNTPWEAKAFAMVVHLHQQGHFSWSEWTEVLSAEIATGSRDGSEYYLLWLAAAEKLVDGKSLVAASALESRKTELAAEQAR